MIIYLLPTPIISNDFSNHLLLPIFLTSFNFFRENKIKINFTQNFYYSILVLLSLHFYFCRLKWLYLKEVFKKWYFVTKIVLTYCEKKLLKFEAEGREFAKMFDITRTIYSNSERSEQFLVTECFFNLFLEVSQI